MATTLTLRLMNWHMSLLGLLVLWCACVRDGLVGAQSQGSASGSEQDQDQDQNFTIINGQIFTPGLAIVDAPQPGTPEGGGVYFSFSPLFESFFLLLEVELLLVISCLFDAVVRIRGRWWRRGCLEWYPRYR